MKCFDFSDDSAVIEHIRVMRNTKLSSIARATRLELEAIRESYQVQIILCRVSAYLALGILGGSYLAFLINDLSKYLQLRVQAWAKANEINKIKNNLQKDRAHRLNHRRCSMHQASRDKSSLLNARRKIESFDALFLTSVFEQTKHVNSLKPNYLQSRLDNVLGIRN